MIVKFRELLKEMEELGLSGSDLIQSRKYLTRFYKRFINGKAVKVNKKRYKTSNSKQDAPFKKKDT